MLKFDNPLDTDVDLSNYYLSDQNEYFNWPDQDAGSSRDFLFKFPNNFISIFLNLINFYNPEFK